MSQIQIGDRVTCIDIHSHYIHTAIPLMLVEGRDYIVYGIRTTPCCGVLTLDVGIPDTGNTGTMHCICGGNSPTNGIAWKLASRFIRKEETKQAEKVEAVSAIKLTRELSISEN